VLADSALMAMLQPGDHGSTFGGNPLSCHVALESLKVIAEEKLTENSEKMGKLFRASVRELGSPLVLEVRGKGLLNAVVFDFGGKAEKDQELSLALRDAGLLVKAAKTNVFRFAPPLVITEAQVREAVAILGKVLKGFNP
jgi:ornithine--oxo-acid transaminase